MKQHQADINKKRIAKNTLLLYVRLFCVLLLSFFITRLLLRRLGIEDFGLYNVIFGFVTSFCFFSGAMQSTVRRFLCHELGQGKTEEAGKVFSVSCFLFILLSAGVFILAETIGLWFVLCKLNIPADRRSIAQIIYQFSIFMTLFKILQIPFISAVTSYENMRIFSILSIADAGLHLLSVVALKFIPENRLIAFIIFYTLSNLIILLSYIGYCWKNYDICHKIFSFKVDKQHLKSMCSFFSWNLFGSIATVSKHQGLNLLLNTFCGITMNATWGIAYQVSGALNQLAANFQQAFNPTILKSYGNVDRDIFFDFLRNCSKYSFLLAWIITLPIMLRTEFFLKIWLGNVLPEKVVLFTQLMMIYVLLETISQPLWVTIHATGNIKKYQILISCFTCSVFFISWFLLWLGFAAYSVLLVNILINFLCLIYRLVHLKKEIAFPIKVFLTKTLIPIGLIGCSGYFCGSYLNTFFNGHFYTIFLQLFIVSTLNLFLIWTIGISKKERKFLSEQFWNFLKKHRTA